MKNKIIVGAILICILIVFALLFHRGCGPKSAIRNPQSAIVPAVDNPPVVAPQFPTTDVPDPNPSPDVQRELNHYKNRYAHYKSEAVRLGERLAALDSLLDADGLGCEEKQRLLAEKIKEMEAGEGSAAVLVDELNEELAPRRDTGRVNDPNYTLSWQIDHFGKLLPDGFTYDLDLKERTVQCPDCPTPKRVLKRNLSAFYGYDLDGHRRYGLEARRQWRRVSLSGLVVYDGLPSGMVGVGWSW